MLISQSSFDCYKTKPSELFFLVMYGSLSPNVADKKGTALNNVVNAVTQRMKYVFKLCK